jgi:hypothetical protein
MISFVFAEQYGKTVINWYTLNYFFATPSVLQLTVIYHIEYFSTCNAKNGARV